MSDAADALDDILADVAKGELTPVYVLWGEEFLIRKDAEALVKALVPEAAAGLNYIVLDSASPREIADELATMPLFPGRKVVLSRDPEFVAPKKGRADALSKARDAWRSGKRKEGARRLLALAARAGWGPTQLDPSARGAPSAEDWKDELNVELAEVDLAFLKEVAAFCREEGITAPESDSSALLLLLEKGLPEGHVWVLAATDLDAKHPLLKWAQKEGHVLERKVAAKLKDLDLSELAKDVLAPFKKRLSRDAEAALKDRLGANMRLVQSELEKLALYVSGPVIEVADVQLLVARVRGEEFLELSDALQKRDLKAALRYTEDAMGQGSAPLMVLGAIASVVRTLVENQERVKSFGRGQAPRSFDEFRSRVWPAIEAEAKAQKLKVPHPYGAFLGMSASVRYGRGELRRAWKACAEADLALKSSGNGRLVLDRLLWTLLGKSTSA